MELHLASVEEWEIIFAATLSSKHRQHYSDLAAALALDYANKPQSAVSSDPAWTLSDAFFGKLNTLNNAPLWIECQVASDFEHGLEQLVEYLGCYRQAQSDSNYERKYYWENEINDMLTPDCPSVPD